MTNPDNPVGRLYKILTSAKELARKSPSNNPPTMRFIWANLFEVDSKDTGHILEVYLELLKLVRTSKEAIREIPTLNNEVTMKHFDRLELAFSTNSFEHQWANFDQFLDPATMTALEIFADTLSNLAGEKLIDKGEIEKLLNEVETLLRSVREDDIPNELKIFLVEKLEEIRLALIYYRINGADGLSRALEIHNRCNVCL